MMLDGEAMRGLPDRLPRGETLIWQGSPALASVATHAFHIVWLGVYFGILVGWAAISAALHGEPPAILALTVLKFGGLACAALGLVTLYSWMVARSTVYTITSRRVVMRVGVCLPITINIPFSQMSAAGLRLFGDGHGDIELNVDRATQRMSYVLLWPHARPWAISRPRPLLASVPDARFVATVLGRAVAAAASQDDEVKLVPIAAATQTGASGRAHEPVVA